MQILAEPLVTFQETEAAKGDNRPFSPPVGPASNSYCTSAVRALVRRTTRLLSLSKSTGNPLRTGSENVPCA